MERTVTLKATPTSVAVGAKVTLSGAVTKSPKGTAVIIERRKGSGWAKVKTVKTTDTKGSYKTTVKPSAAGTVKYRARVAKGRAGGNTLGAATSPTRKVTVKSKGRGGRAITIQAPSTSIAYENVTVRGTATNTAAGTFVSIECFDAGYGWDACGTGKVNASGKYTAEFQIQQVGVVRMRAALLQQKTSGGTLPKVVSDVVSIRVIGADNSGPIKLVTISTASDYAQFGGENAAFSSDGRYVAFVSRSPDLVEGVDPQGKPNVFVRDMHTNTVWLVSTTLAGQPMRQLDVMDEVGVDISDDGRTVVFTSSDPDLVAGDTNGHTDVFVRRLVDGTLGPTTMVSLNSAGLLATATSLDDYQSPVSISGDGTKVLFSSYLPLVPEDSNGGFDVYTRNLTIAGTSISLGALTRVSLTTTGEQVAVAHSGLMSKDGKYAVFFGASANLAPGPAAYPRGLYRRNLTTGVVDTIEFHDDVYFGAPMGVAVSATGHRVAYSWVGGRVWHAATGTTTPFPQTQSGQSAAKSVAMSGDGSTVAFSDDNRDDVPGDNRANVQGFYFDETYVFNVDTGAVRLGSATVYGAFGGGGFFGGSSWPFGLSFDGRYLLFGSNSQWLIRGFDDKDAVDIFVRDMQAPLWSPS